MVDDVNGSATSNTPFPLHLLLKVVIARGCFSPRDCYYSDSFPETATYFARKCMAQGLAKRDIF